MEVTLNIPEQYVVGSSPDELGRRIKLYAALIMFQSGELSVGAAAEFAGIDRFTFAEECRTRGIPVIDYPAEDLRAELNALRSAF